MKPAHLLALCLAALLPASPALADPVRASLARDLLAETPIGTWNVEITTFNCVSLKANPTFESVLSFGAEGNEMETTSNPMFQPGQRSPAFGVWHFAGPRIVSLTTKAYILFPLPSGPIRQGTQIIRHAIQLKADHSFEDNAIVTYYDTAGVQTLKGCAAAIGHRL